MPKYTVGGGDESVLPEDRVCPILKDGHPTGEVVNGVSAANSRAASLEIQFLESYLLKKQKTESASAYQKSQKKLQAHLDAQREQQRTGVVAKLENPRLLETSSSELSS